MIRRFLLLLCVSFILPSMALAQSQPASNPPAPTGGIGPKEPVLDATDRLSRKINVVERRAKFFKITSIVLSSAGAAGGFASVLSAKVIDNPDTQEAVGSFSGVMSAVSSGLGLLFHFEARAGKNKDCLDYLRSKTSEFTNKWTNGVPPDRAAEFEADKDKIENGHGGKCGKRLELY